MSTFPILKTGAVLQYPAGRTLEHSTCVLEFLDGSEQRFRESSSPARRWAISLDLLDEGEMAALEDFLVSRQGRSGTFAFTDPWDGTTHENCSLQDDINPLVFQDLLRGHVALVVREDRT